MEEGRILLDGVGQTLQRKQLMTENGDNTVNASPKAKGGAGTRTWKLGLEPESHSPKRGKRYPLFIGTSTGWLACFFPVAACGLGGRFQCRSKWDQDDIQLSWINMLKTGK